MEKLLARSDPIADTAPMFVDTLPISVASAATVVTSDAMPATVVTLLLTPATVVTS